MFSLLSGHYNQSIYQWQVSSNFLKCQQSTLMGLFKFKLHINFTPSSKAPLSRVMRRHSVLLCLLRGNCLWRLSQVCVALNLRGHYRRIQHGLLVHTRALIERADEVVCRRFIHEMFVRVTRRLNWVRWMSLPCRCLIRLLRLSRQVSSWLR